MKVYILFVVIINSVLSGPILHKIYDHNVEEIGGNFEGDIVITPEQEQILNGYGRTGLVDLRYRWPDNTVIYSLSSAFDADQKAYIELGLQRIEEVTCLKFVPRTDQINYVQVTGANTGCHSNAGYLGGGAQSLNLQLSPPGQGCLTIGTIIHEFLHTLGFFHMQSATERDDYVTIMWENIEPGLEGNFQSYGPDVISNFGVTYDVASVMHYPAYGFSKNGLPTIVPHDMSLIDVMGQRLGLTQKDIDRINRMYKCDTK